MPTVNDIALAIYGACPVIGKVCCKRQDVRFGTLDSGYYCNNCGHTTILEKVVRLKVQKLKPFSMKDLTGSE